MIECLLRMVSAACQMAIVTDAGTIFAQLSGNVMNSVRQTCQAAKLLGRMTPQTEGKAK